MGLQKKAGLYGGAGLLILVGALAFLGVRAVHKSTQRSLDERILIAQTVANSVDQTIAKTVRDLEQFAALHTQSLADSDPNPEARALDDFYRLSRTISPIFLLDRDGKVIHIQPPQPERLGKPLIEDSAMFATLQARKSYISSNVAPGSAQARVFSVLVPMLGASEIGRAHV
jgi:hypothetical protein